MKRLSVFAVAVVLLFGCTSEPGKKYKTAEDYVYAISNDGFSLKDVPAQELSKLSCWYFSWQLAESKIDTSV
jgi:hypothetical protein